MDDMSNFSEAQRQELRDKIAFFKSICKQFYDVKELRARYLEEDRVSGHIPEWKHPARERKHSQVMHIKPTERYAPPISDKSAEAYYRILPQNRWFTLHELAGITRSSPKYCRRILYWLGVRRFIRYSTATTMYRRREGKDKGSFKIVSQFTQDCAVQYRNVSLQNDS